MWSRLLLPFVGLLLLHQITAQISIEELSVNILLANISPQCKSQVMAVGTNLKQKWALQMLDSTAKPQAGILYGNVMHVGNYDECLEIDHQTISGRIQGKYCTALMAPHPKFGDELSSLISSVMPVPSKIESGNFLVESRKSFGFCVPKACSVPDLQTLSDLLENRLNSSVHFTFVEVFCTTSDPQIFTPGALATIVIFCLFALVVAGSSLYDVFHYQKLPKHKQHPTLLIAFSVVTNGKKILSTHSTEDTMGCLNGLRVLSMMWIVLVHGYHYLFFLPHTNTFIVDSWKNQTEQVVIFAAGMAVDTFFVISGLLVVFLYMKAAAKGVKFNVVMFYVHRILRLTPSLAMLVLLVATLLPFMGNGPFWYGTVLTYSKPCQDYWWTTITYSLNYVSTDEQCLGHAWYLAVDTQMYFLSPLVLVPLTKWPKKTIATLVVLTALSCGCAFQTTFVRNFGVVFFTLDHDQTRMLYQPTHIRGAVYLVGMIAGYVIFRAKQSKVKLSKVVVFALWSLSVAALLGISYSHMIFYRGDYNRLDAALFNSLSRVSWSLATAAVIFLCVNNHGGVVNSFLSNKIFTVLIRLNYNIYLLHLIVMAVVATQDRAQTHFSNIQAYHQFWGNYMYSVGAAVVWTLAFESPVLAIEKYFFRKRDVRSSSEEANRARNIVQETANGDTQIEIVK